MTTGHIIENCVIYICTTTLVLALFYMSKSWHSLWGLGLLAWSSYPGLRSKGR